MATMIMILSAGVSLIRIITTSSIILLVIGRLWIGIASGFITYRSHYNKKILFRL